jgi:glycine betaine catabolism A
MTAVTNVHIRGLTEGEAAGIQHFDKPKPGTWTEAFGLDTGPVPLHDCFDPEFFELEKEAVFRRSWLYAGRVQELPRKGSYLTKELTFLGVSVLVMRGMDDEIRAFHNVCSHRGNRLVWDDFPDRETSGNCRQLACKYHGWRYGLDGEINYVHNAPEFFDLKAEELALPKIHCEVWAGFIFINLMDEPTQNLRDSLGEDICKLESYPFDKLTQHYRFEAIVDSNWKIIMDAFQELYHVPYVHGKMNNPTAAATGIDKVPFMMPEFHIFGKHRLYVSGGPFVNDAARGGRPLDRAFSSTFYGPVRKADVGDLGDGINPGQYEFWGLDSWQIYPNLDILIWNPNWYLTYEYQPVDANHHKFIWNAYFAPPRDMRERLAQEHTVHSVREFAIQDTGAVAAMQHGLRHGVKDSYEFCDQEVLARHLHHHIYADVDAYLMEQS